MCHLLTDISGCFGTILRGKVLTLIRRLRRTINLDIKVPEIVLMRHCTDTRDTGMGIIVSEFEVGQVLNATRLTVRP
jgi:hypothetical protein